MFCGDFINRLRRIDLQHFHFAQTDTLPFPLFRRNRSNGFVDSFQPLDITFKSVNEHTIKNMTEHLGQRRIAGQLTLMAGAGIAGHTDHHHPVGAQMQRRTDRSKLTHCPVTKITPLDGNRRKQNRNRRRSEQMMRG